MPDAVETVCRPVSTRRGAVEGDRGTASVGCHCRRIKHVLQFISRAHVIDVVPSRAVVVRCSDNCLGASASSTGHYKIDPAVIINANLRVLQRRVRGSPGDRAYIPRDPVILRHQHSALATTAIVWNENRSVRRNLDVTMQAAASRRCQNGWPKRQSTIIAPGRLRDIEHDQRLRRIVDGVGIDRAWRTCRNRRMIRTAADRFVVDA